MKAYLVPILFGACIAPVILLISLALVSATLIPELISRLF